MIRELIIKDNEQYLRLGNLINSKFTRLFPLEQILSNDNDYLYGYYIKDALIAFIHITKSFEIIEINNIVVDQDYRRKNIGTKLINYIIEKFSDTKEILLEVRSKNINAIDFYKKNNFTCINIRKNYYDNDDAYIMKRGV